MPTVGASGAAGENRPGFLRDGTTSTKMDNPASWLRHSAQLTCSPALSGSLSNITNVYIAHFFAIFDNTLLPFYQLCSLLCRSTRRVNQLSCLQRRKQNTLSNPNPNEIPHLDPQPNHKPNVRLRSIISPSTPLR